MTGNVASFLALVPMLFHSILGCCWHHGHLGVDHSVVMGQSPAAVQSVETVGWHPSHAVSACCSPAVDSEHQQPPADSSPNSPCGQHDCGYSDAAITVASQTVTFDCWECAFFAFTEPFAAQTPRSISWSERPSDFASAHHPQQWRAWHQIWLI